MEKKAVIQKKTGLPLSIRRVSASIHSIAQGVNPSGNPRVVKPPEGVSFQSLPKTRWRVHHYASFRPNLIWGKCLTIRSDSFTGLSLWIPSDDFSTSIVVRRLIKAIPQPEGQSLGRLAALSKGTISAGPCLACRSGSRE